MTAPSSTGLNCKELAQSLLDYVVTAYDGATDTDPLPALRLVRAGEIRLTAWDCQEGQVTVSLTGVDIDTPTTTPNAPSQIKATSLRHAAFTVQVVRCVPVMNEDREVDFDAVHASGLQAMRDAGLMSQALFEWATRAVSVDTPNGVLTAGLGAIIPVGPQGGLAAMEGQVVVSCLRLD